MFALTSVLLMEALKVNNNISRVVLLDLKNQVAVLACLGGLTPQEQLGHELEGQGLGDNF